MPEIKKLPKSGNKRGWRDREIAQAKLKAKSDSIGDRTRLDNMSEDVRFLINEAIPDDFEDPKIQKSKLQFNRQFDLVVDLKDKLTQAQKTQKKLYEHYLEYNRAAFDLAGLEIALLKSIESGYQDAAEAERDEVIKKINEKAEIEQDYKDRIDVPVRNMTPERKKAYSEDRAIAKKEYIAATKKLNIKYQRQGSYADLKIDLSRIKRTIRALTARINSQFPLPESLKNMSALETVSIVDRIIETKSMDQAESGR